MSEREGERGSETQAQKRKRAEREGGREREREREGERGREREQVLLGQLTECRNNSGDALLYVTTQAPP